MRAGSVILAPLSRLVRVGRLEQDGLELLVAQTLAVAIGARVSAVVSSVVVVGPHEEDVEEEGAQSPEQDAGDGDGEESATGAVLLLPTSLPGGLAVGSLAVAVDEGVDSLAIFSGVCKLENLDGSRGQSHASGTDARVADASSDGLVGWFCVCAPFMSQ